jgi:di/tricarboxylate transporter
MDEGDEETNRWYPSDTTFAEVRVPDDSGFIGQTLTWIDFRQRFGVSVLAIRRGGVVRRSNLQSWRLSAGDHLLLHASAEKLEELRQASGFADYRLLQKGELMDRYQLQKRLFTLSVPAESHLVGKTLEESRLGDALGLTVMGVIRGGEKLSAAAAKAPIEAGDQLVAVGRSEDLVILRGLKELVIEREVTASLVDFESEQSGLIEAVLSPRTSLTGRTLRQLNFRDRYGLTVLGILREGKSYSTKLRDMPLKFGDALLLHGPREKLKLLAREPDFVVLTEALQERPQYEKSPMALLGLLCFLVPVLLGWVPIYIGALLGAAVMVLAGCLSIEKAYAAVNWRAVVLIAGMLPMGTAMLESGTAALLAQRFVGFIGPFGPHAIIAGIFVLTSLATCVIPSTALVVLLAPIAMKTAADMGISPHAVMMTVAMAAAGSFNSPISHPANIMIMGPGGYRFVDYFRVGIPLTFVVMIVVLLTVPVFWPLDAVPK